MLAIASFVLLAACAGGASKPSGAAGSGGPGSAGSSTTGSAGAGGGAGAAASGAAGAAGGPAGLDGGASDAAGAGGTPISGALTGTQDDPGTTGDGTFPLPGPYADTPESLSRLDGAPMGQLLGPIT